ncbi:MAG: dUTP diphosphatase [Dongiaceae bacterium]
MTVPIERLAHGRDLPLPAYATSGSAGLDLMAAIATPIELAPGARDLVPAGVTLALPAGYEAQIRPRSGLALKHGITVLNSPGTIDSDYRGEIKVLLVNHGQDAFRVEPGMRIAQLVVAPIVRIAWAEDAAQPASERGAGGYGSTGVAAR